MTKRKSSFAAFFLAWAIYKKWSVPDFHWRIVDWLDNQASTRRVLLVFRGAAKSTINAVFKAYQLFEDPEFVTQIWAADDKLARKLTRDTLNVLRRHPWCKGMLPNKPGTQAFWVTGATDARNASMEAIGVSSNATGSRANVIDFDDVEVPKNIRTAEARENLREKISESTHIAVPGAQFTFTGTPHTHNSVYTEQVDKGAAVLKIPLFEIAVRYEETSVHRHYRFDRPIGADGLYVFAGIGKYSKLLVEGRDYRQQLGFVIFTEPPRVVIDLYSGCAWPERFTRKDLLERRKETNTLNAWDSQYMLEAKSIGETRLDPTKLRVYELEPRFETRNRARVMMLGHVQIVGSTVWWDCSLGKLSSDASAVAFNFTDAAGQLYWHRALGLTGELEEVDSRGNLVGGQCKQLLDVMVELQCPHVLVEVNGPGGFVPSILRKHAKKLGIAVGERLATTNKQKRILDAIEPPLSSRFLWAHTSVTAGPAWDQLQDFNPLSTTQADDYIDAEAGAIIETPMRIGKTVGIPQGTLPENWRPHGGVHEVTVED